MPGPGTLTVTKDFAWNIEEYLQCSKQFDWWVGEGPLFWWRIEWKNPICPPTDCVPDAEECEVHDSPPDCKCTTPVPQGDCEVWHVMATSVIDLCRRLNKECCNRYLFRQKVIKSIQFYDRPALCCDVDQFLISGIPIGDQYINVDFFCECECVSWVDPCDCGAITVPCDDDVPYKPCSPVSVTDALNSGLVSAKKPLSVKPGFDVSKIQVMKPQTDTVVNKCGQPLPSMLKMTHDLAKADVIKEFLTRNKLALPAEVDLLYSSSSDSWQKCIHLDGHGEKWTVMFSLACVGGSWRTVVHVNRLTGEKHQATRILAELTAGPIFGINFSYNKVVTSEQPVKTSTAYDGIGMLRRPVSFRIGV